MSANLSIEGPYSLSSLPRPLHVLQGKYQAAPVWEWSQGSKKRKRPELAIGIDGEGVNIYNVISISHHLLNSDLPRKD